MKIILISLQKSLDTIGLKQLHYYLLAHGHQSTILYLPTFNPHDNAHLKCIRKFIEATNPGFIGISLMSIEYRASCRLTAYLKTFLKSVPIIWGGIHPTISPQPCLEYADYVCLGEGLDAILNVASALQNKMSIKDVKNLCYMQRGRLKCNELHPLIEDLEMIPIYDHVPVNSYVLENHAIVPLTNNILRKYLRWSGTVYSIISSYGCPFACAYCSNNYLSRLYGTNIIRRRSISNLIGELEKAVHDNPEIETINFQDSSFIFGDQGYLKDLLKVYKDRVNKPFVARAIPRFVTRDSIKLLKEAGLAWMTVGLQSGSDRVLTMVYHRQSCREDFVRAAAIIKEYNIAAFYDVILDNPYENDDDVLKTVETIIETPRPFYLQLFSLTLYCGTDLYAKAKMEMPEYADDWLDKDHNYPSKTDINKVVRLAAYFNPNCVKNIMALYKYKPRSIQFRIYLGIASILSALIFEPWMYFRVLKLSFGGSCWQTIRHIPLYFREGIVHYINQFGGGGRKRTDRKAPLSGERGYD